MANFDLVGDAVVSWICGLATISTAIYGLGGELRCERGGLPRALEPHVAGARPRQGVPLAVRDRDDGVVERRLDVGLSVDDVLLLAPAGLLRLGLGHGLLPLLPLHADGLLRSLAGSGVGVRPLAVHRQRTPMAQALVARDLDLALDVLGHVAAEVTLDLEVPVDVLADPYDLLLGEIADLRRRVH